MRAGAVAAEAGELGPGLAGVGGAEESGVFDAGVDGVGVGEGGLEVPDALELPGVRGAVVPLVRAGDAVVGELVADGLPGFAAVVGALDELAEPAATLRGVDAVGVHGRAFEVVQLKAGEVRAADLPVLTLAVGGDDECSFAGAYQYSYLAHSFAPLESWFGLRCQGGFMLRFGRPRGYRIWGGLV